MSLPLYIARLENARTVPTKTTVAPDYAALVAMIKVGKPEVFQIDFATIKVLNVWGRRVGKALAYRSIVEGYYELSFKVGDLRSYNKTAKEQNGNS